MDKFIQRQKLQNVTEKEIENLNKSIKSKKKKKIELVIKNINKNFTKEAQTQMTILANSTKCLKEN